MEKKNEIKVVSKELTKYRVCMTATIDIEVDVYAEEEHEARQIAEQEICVTEYSNDTIGIELNRSWSWDMTRDSDQKIEIVGVSASGYIEEYDTTAKDSIMLYAREEDGFDEYENVFTDEQELLDWYAEDEDEDDEDNEDSDDDNEDSDDNK
jgi:hypothetical protein